MPHSLAASFVPMPSSAMVPFSGTLEQHAEAVGVRAVLVGALDAHEAAVLDGGDHRRGERSDAHHRAVDDHASVRLGLKRRDVGFARGEVAARARLAVDAGAWHARASGQGKLQHTVVLLDAGGAGLREAVGKLAGAALHFGVVGAGRALAQHVEGDAGHRDHAGAGLCGFDARVRVGDRLRCGAERDVGFAHGRGDGGGRLFAGHAAFGHAQDERPPAKRAGGFVEELAHLARGVVGDHEQRFVRGKREVGFDDGARSLVQIHAVSSFQFVFAVQRGMFHVKHSRDGAVWFSARPSAMPPLRLRDGGKGAAVLPIGGWEGAAVLRAISSAVSSHPPTDRSRRFAEDRGRSAHPPRAAGLTPAGPPQGALPCPADASSSRSAPRNARTPPHRKTRISLRRTPSPPLS